MVLYTGFEQSEAGIVVTGDTVHCTPITISATLAIHLPSLPSLLSYSYNRTLVTMTFEVLCSQVTSY